MFFFALKMLNWNLVNMFHFTELEKFCVFFKKLDLIAILHLKPNALLSITVTITVRSNPPEVFLGKGVVKICSKFTRDHPCWSMMAGMWCVQHGCSPVNLLHIFRTPLLKNTSGGLLLNSNCSYLGQRLRWRIVT